MELIQLLAINALEFTAPVYSFLNKDLSPQKATSTEQKPSTSLQPEEADTTPKKRHNHHHHQTLRSTSSNSLVKSACGSGELKIDREIIQLSGHPGSFAPAGPNSIWKKMPEG
jgi:hypothetical protein